MGRGEFIGLRQNQFCQFTKSEGRMTMINNASHQPDKKELANTGKE